MQIEARESTQLTLQGKHSANSTISIKRQEKAGQAFIQCTDTFIQLDFQMMRPLIREKKSRNVNSNLKYELQIIGKMEKNL